MYRIKVVFLVRLSVGVEHYDMKAGYYGREEGLDPGLSLSLYPRTQFRHNLYQWQFVPGVIKWETASHIFLSVYDIDFCLILIKWRFVTAKVGECELCLESILILYFQRNLKPRAPKNAN